MIYSTLLVLVFRKYSYRKYVLDNAETEPPKNQEKKRNRNDRNDIGKSNEGWLYTNSLLPLSLGLQKVYEFLEGIIVYQGSNLVESMFYNIVRQLSV